MSEYLVFLVEDMRLTFASLLGAEFMASLSPMDLINLWFIALVILTFLTIYFIIPTAFNMASDVYAYLPDSWKRSPLNTSSKKKEASK